MTIASYSYRVLNTATVDFLQLHKNQPNRYPFLLESVAYGTKRARYNILFAFPQQHIALINDCLCGDALVPSTNFSQTPFLTALDQAWMQSQLPYCNGDSSVPFRGGWFIYLGYEIGQQIESCLPKMRSTNAGPSALAVRIPAALIYDHQLKQTSIVVENAYQGCLDLIEQDCQFVCKQPRQNSIAPIKLNDWHEETSQLYLERIQRVLSYIREGDVFQVNLSRLWQGEVSARFSSAEAYAGLRLQNPGTFAGIMQWDDFAVMSSSPERLVSVTRGVVATRPIAGTRPRNRLSAQDQQLKAELIAHPKERAEHVMLIDLARNDLGRVCQPGSVRVNELMVLESYAHVHHIVSNVIGQLNDDCLPGDVIRAIFPGGTITGCPKIRCMQIIAELEQCARSSYTGSMGYLNHDGDMDLNILIRTLEKSHSTLSFRTGAGIVADSVPEYELAETRTKAKGLLLALGIT